MKIKCRSTDHIGTYFPIDMNRTAVWKCLNEDLVRGKNYIFVRTNSFKNSGSAFTQIPSLNFVR